MATELDTLVSQTMTDLKGMHDTIFEDKVTSNAIERFIHMERLLANDVETQTTEVSSC